MSFLQHILAVFTALSLIPVVGPQAAVARASWHICLANGIVAHSWGRSAAEDEANRRRCAILRVARTRLLAAADAHKVRGEYQGLWTLWLHWRLPARAPEVAGLPSTNVYGL